MELIPDGYARVSEILSIFQAYSFVERNKLKKAQETGTLIHAAIEQYLKGGFDPVHPSIQGYLDSFLSWLNQKDLVPSMQEKRLYDHEYKFTGRPDLIGTLNGEETVIDFKTGSWAHPEIWKLQGTFYRRLCEVDPPVKGAKLPDRFLFLQLQKTGEAPREFYFQHEPSNWEICKKAIDLYWYFTKSVD